SGSFFFSPLLTRQFSSSTTWPGCTSTPSTQLRTSGTLRPSSSVRRAATGASESSGLNSPSLGRPRCEVTITAAPACSAIWIQGTEARMRVSSVMLPASSCGTLRSARMKTRWPLALPWAQRSEKRRTFMRCFDSAKLVILGGRQVPSRPASPAQAEMQRQVHGHTGDDGEQHAAAPDVQQRPSRRGEQPRILPAGHQMAARHDDLRRDDSGQSSDGRVLQRAFGPGWQAPRPVQDEKEAAAQHCHACQADDHSDRPRIGAAHAVGLVAGAMLFSRPKLASTATAIATTMFSFSGSAYAATAAAPASTADSSRSGVLASEHRMPVRHSTQAKPRPQALGIRLPRATPATLAIIQLLQVTKYV